MTVRLLGLLGFFLLVLPRSGWADWSLKRDPFDPRLVERYKTHLHKNPHDVAALRKLMGLYKAHRSLEKLAVELSRTADHGDVADLVVVSRFLIERGHRAQAEAELDRAVKAEPENAILWSLFGDVLLGNGKSTEARFAFESALKHPEHSHLEKELHRKLADLAFAADRGLPLDEAMKEARAHLESLIKLDPQNDDLRRELGEALASHGQPAEGAELLRVVALRTTRDPAMRAATLKRAAELFLDGGKESEARACTTEALKLVPAGHSLQRELLETQIAIHRKTDDLRDLVLEWEKTWSEASRGLHEWDVLGRLHAELGDLDTAVRCYEKALARDSHALDTRRRLISLLERSGADERVVAEYRRLVASAPGEPRFRLELADRLYKTTGATDGRPEALRMLTALGRQSRDPAVHRALADLYDRFGLPDQALGEEALLTKLEPDDESHLLSLAELYWQKGEQRRAEQLWQSLIHRRTRRPQAMAKVAEVYVEHGRTGEALDLLEKAAALDPQNRAIQKAHAQALERMHREPEAAAEWEAIFSAAVARKDRTSELEARQRLLSLLGRLGRLASALPGWRERENADGQDAIAYGLLVADALIQLGRLPDAQSSLAKLSQRQLSDDEVVAVALGRAHIEQVRHRPKEALAVLEHAAERAPGRARELYPRIAELSLELLREGDALTYAKKAVELSPTDPQALIGLGEILEKRRDLAGATEAYGRALELDGHLHRLRFRLARLHLQAGREKAATLQYREILRRCSDEELIVDAARGAIDLAELLGTLDELGRDLIPLAALHPDRPVYRGLVVEFGEREISELHDRMARGDSEATRSWSRLAEQLTPPLLDVLVAGTSKEMRGAAALLYEIGTPAAAPLLLKLAVSPSTSKPPTGISSRAAEQTDLRIEAAFAGAHLATERERPLLEKLAVSPERLLRLAGLYGLGRLPDWKRSLPPLIKALRDDASTVQGMACLSSSRQPLFGNSPEGLEGASRLVESRDTSELARTACAVALGFGLASGSEASKLRVGRALIQLLDEGSELPQQGAAFALAALGTKEAASALMRAIFLKAEPVRRQALLAFRRARGQARGQERSQAKGGLHFREPPHIGEDFPLGAWLDSLMAEPPSLSLEGTWETALDALGEALARHRELRLRALSDLAVDENGRLSLQPLDFDESVREPASEGRAHLIRLLATLGEDEDEVVAVEALTVLGRLAGRDEPIFEAVHDSLVRVLSGRRRLLGLEALVKAGSRPAATLIPSLTTALWAPDWQSRRAAALLLRGAPVSSRVHTRLIELTHDANGFVAEAAAAAVERGPIRREPSL